MKQFLLCLAFLFFYQVGFTQKIDSIYVHLYTDSLKKGTYNYINIDGKLTNGNYIPLDSTDIIFSASDCKFHGNSLFVPLDFEKEKITITAVLRQNRSVSKEFTLYIKKKPDPALKTEQEILESMKNNRKKKG